MIALITSENGISHMGMTALSSMEICGPGLFGASNGVFYTGQYIIQQSQCAVACMMY
jgi:hypothetical protein